MQKNYDDMLEDKTKYQENVVFDINKVLYNQCCTNTCQFLELPSKGHEIYQEKTNSEDFVELSSLQFINTFL